MIEEKEFGIWTLPATQDAVRIAAENQFHAAHYDAAERIAKLQGFDCILPQHVEEVQRDRDTLRAAICGACGRFHEPPACQGEHDDVQDNTADVG